MDKEDERDLLRRLRKRRGDDVDDLGEPEGFPDGFEEPARGDILDEKQVREGRRKRI